jgi:hypothetical protein
MSRRAWRRRRAAPDPDAPHPYVRLEPEAERERDLERLQRGWEVFKHPDALVEALTLCTATGGCNPRPLPEWLTAALIEVLRTPPTRLARIWTVALRQRRADLIDYARYDALREAREHGLTWTQSAEWARRHVRGNVTPAAALKSYQRVRASLRRGELGRYAHTRAATKYWGLPP